MLLFTPQVTTCPPIAPTSAAVFIDVADMVWPSELPEEYLAVKPSVARHANTIPTLLIPLYAKYALIALDTLVISAPLNAPSQITIADFHAPDETPVPFKPI